MKRCLIVTKADDIPPDVSANDRAEIEKFMTYVRLVAEAKRASVPHAEACEAIYPDVYEPGKP